MQMGSTNCTDNTSNIHHKCSY